MLEVIHKETIMLKAQTITSCYQGRLFRFAIVGGTGTVVNLGIMYLMTDIVGLYYIFSYIIAFTAALFNNYLLNSRWTFKQEARISGLLKYAGVSVFTLAINEGLIYLLTGKLGLWYMLSTMISILTAFLINYSISRRIVWK